MKQVWFVGSHSDVGGGHKADRDGGQLSDIPLAWMMKEAKDAGLAFEPHLGKRLKPKPTAALHDSSSLKFRSWKDTWRPINHGKGKVLIHTSVKDRGNQDRGYRPKNVVKYLDKRKGGDTELEN